MYRWSVSKETLINSANEMKHEAHGTQQPRHINMIGEGASTAQRSDSLVQSINQRFPKTSLIIACGLGLILSTSLAYAGCSGCLCPGDPCKLCPLPAMQDVPLKPNEHELCARIRESVSPTLAQPGSNEYFSSLDKATMVCVREGGDVIRNKQRSAEFSSRVYCKPPKMIKN